MVSQARPLSFCLANGIKTRRLNITTTLPTTPRSVSRYAPLTNGAQMALGGRPVLPALIATPGRLSITIPCMPTGPAPQA